MSLILDALRKADAERERGSVPSLHAQPMVPLSSETLARPRARPAWMWGAAGLAAGLAVAATWVMVARDAPSAPADAEQVPVGPGASAGMAPAPGAAPPASVPSPAPAKAAPGTPAGQTDGQDIAPPAPWPAREERKEARAEPQDKPAVAYLGNVPPNDAAVNAHAPLPSREQLPAEIRAALPPFTIGGSIYSPSPAGRSLIVNGQLYRERDRLTQDLTLEEIRLKAATFSFRGHRFEVLF